MQNKTKDQQAILSLLTQIYLEIVDIETRFKLIAGKGDMRPRIDYFHDAIRAFTSDGENSPRLSVELLSYDLRCLRYIQKMPLAPFREGGESLSPSQDIITMEAGLLPLGGRADRKTRARITELYQNYGVMFAALLKPAAEHDYQERTDTLNQDVKDIQSIIVEFEGKADAKTISELTQQLEEPELRVILATFIQQKKHKNIADIKKLLGHLKNHIAKKDSAIKSIESAHMGFAVAQLGIFEESKDMLKGLAKEGMNLVGKFVEASIADTRKQMGRQQ